jgi:hypothetical protein
MTGTKKKKGFFPSLPPSRPPLRTVERQPDCERFSRLIGIPTLHRRAISPCDLGKYTRKNAGSEAMQWAEACLISFPSPRPMPLVLPPYRHNFVFSQFDRCAHYRLPDLHAWQYKEMSMRIFLSQACMGSERIQVVSLTARGVAHFLPSVKSFGKASTPTKNMMQDTASALENCTTPMINARPVFFGKPVSWGRKEGRGLKLEYLKQSVPGGFLKMKHRQWR